MRKRVSQLLFLILLVFICSSCTKGKDRTKVAQYVYKMEVTKVIDEIFLVTDDVELLARVLKCSPSTIIRLENKISIPTYEAELAFKELLINIKTSSNEKEYLIKIDPINDHFFRQIKLFFFSESGLIAGVVLLVVMIIVGAFLRGGIGALGVLAIWGGVWIIDWVISFFYDKIELVDNFKVVINTVWEKTI